MAAAGERLVLTVNAGSSSVRLGLFAAGEGEPVRRRTLRHAEPDLPADALVSWLGEEAARVAVVAHRVVHGGPTLRAPCPVDDTVREAIEAMNVVAPLHNPRALALLAQVGQALPRAQPVAVFDTGFFASLPAVTGYALPRSLTGPAGLARLGFHGLAHESLWRAFAAQRPPRSGRVISFQLGSGCSVAALRDGAPVETSMGFTPLEGLVMATRPGDLDPGLLLYLLKAKGFTVDGLTALLEEQSGLLGVSGLSGDVRALLASGAPEAEEAIALYVHRARKYLGAYLVTLGGCDAILVGGGAGEGSAALRARLFSGLEAFGILLDPQRNEAAHPPAPLHAEGSAVALWLLPTDEETILARAALPWLRGALA